MKIGGESPRYELVPVSPQAPPPDAPASRASGPSFSAALKGVGSAVDRGEALIARAAHGDLGGLDSAQLIALQAGIYRYSEAVDLVAKLVDRASSAAKTVISPHS
jgi:hypothetical protein